MLIARAVRVQRSTKECADIACEHNSGVISGKGSLIIVIQKIIPFKTLIEGRKRGRRTTLFDALPVASILNDWLIFVNLSERRNEEETERRRRERRRTLHSGADDEMMLTSM